MIVAGLLMLMVSGADAAAVDLMADPVAWTLRATSGGIYTIADGTLTAKRRSYESATILTKDEFENFEVEFEFLVKRWCELIFLIHPAWNGADDAGLELVLNDHHDAAPSPTNAGALLEKRAAASMAMHADDVWNTCRVRYDWPRLVVELNGVTIQDFDMSADEQFRYTLRRGPLGFRDLLGWGFEVRNMRLTRLPDSENGIRMYNAMDLSGWKEVRPRDAKWTADADMIVGTNGNGYLQYERAVQDFDLRFYYRTTPTANGGVFFRWMPDDSDRGNEIQILDVAESVMPSGSIYSIDRADTAGMRAVGEWQLLQLSVRGNRAITHLNGKKCAETDRLTKVWPGHITLQMHKENSTIAFRDMVLVPADRES